MLFKPLHEKVCLHLHHVAVMASLLISPMPCLHPPCSELPVTILFLAFVQSFVIRNCLTWLQLNYGLPLVAMVKPAMHGANQPCIGMFQVCLVKSVNVVYTFLSVTMSHFKQPFLKIHLWSWITWCCYPRPIILLMSDINLYTLSQECNDYFCIMLVVLLSLGCGEDHFSYLLGV